MIVPVDSVKTFVGPNGTYYDESWRWNGWAGPQFQLELGGRTDLRGLAGLPALLHAGGGLSGDGSVSSC